MPLIERKKYSPPLTFQGLADLWGEVVSGKTNVDFFLAQLVRSRPSLDEGSASRLERLVEKSARQHRKE